MDNNDLNWEQLDALLSDSPPKAAENPEAIQPDQAPQPAPQEKRGAGEARQPRPSQEKRGAGETRQSRPAPEKQVPEKKALLGRLGFGGSAKPAEKPASQRKPRPEDTEAAPQRKPRPEGAEAAPQRKPRPEGAQAAPQRRPRPEGTGAAPQRKPRPAGQENTPERKTRPVSQEAAPKRAPRPESQEAAPQRTSQQGEVPQRAPQQGEAPQRAPQQGARRAPQQETAPQRGPRPAPQKNGKPRPAGSAPRSPENGRRPKAPSAMDAGAPMPAVKKSRTTGDAGYTPYQRANEKKKRSQQKQMRNLLSGKNREGKPLLRFGTTAGPETEKERLRKKKAPPAVIYTEARAFSRSRLILQLASVLAVVLAFVLGFSVFFRVKTVAVTGAEVYSPWAIREASGISEGDNLITLGRSKAASQILANLPYVKTARIGIKLPDTVKIEIEEENVIYSIASEDQSWWLINSEGKVIAQSNSAEAAGYTQVLGVELADPQVGQIGKPAEALVLPENESEAAVVAETISEEMIADLITGQSKMDAAMQILKALEKNDIVGSAASVDVGRMNDIILWYGSQYQVNLGDNSNLDYKIACMVDVILQMSDYQSGILDISFTHWPDQVGFTPFS